MKRKLLLMLLVAAAPGLSLVAVSRRDHDRAGIRCREVRGNRAVPRCAVGERREPHALARPEARLRS
ncbi:MAG: hypothetical protein IPI43_11275 [Sandaracinaceae bacterium]|nr:hypothetical protein [Sandaracinaceae bacterium]